MFHELLWLETSIDLDSEGNIFRLWISSTSRKNITFSHTPIFNLNQKISTYTVPEHGRLKEIDRFNRLAWEKIMNSILPNDAECDSVLKPNKLSRRDLQYEFETKPFF